VHIFLFGFIFWVWPALRCWNNHDTWHNRKRPSDETHPSKGIPRVLVYSIAGGRLPIRICVASCVLELILPAIRSALKGSCTCRATQPLPSLPDSFIGSRCPSFRLLAQSGYINLAFLTAAEMRSVKRGGRSVGSRPRLPRVAAVHAAAGSCCVHVRDVRLATQSGIFYSVHRCALECALPIRLFRVGNSDLICFFAGFVQ
jgi:hypothetical protein